MARSEEASFPFMISAMTIAAIADSRLSQREKELLIQLVSLYKRGVDTPSEILQTVEQTVAGLHQIGRPGWKAVLENGRELSAESKRMVVDAATKMAFANGKPSHSMMGVLGSIAFWIGMGEKDLDKWRIETQQLMEKPGIKVGWGPPGHQAS